MLPASLEPVLELTIHSHFTLLSWQAMQVVWWRLLPPHFIQGIPGGLPLANQQTDCKWTDLSCYTSHIPTFRGKYPPSLPPPSSERPPSAFAWLPHDEVLFAPPPHGRPPGHICFPPTAPSPPMQHGMPMPNPAALSTPFPSPRTHCDPDSCLLEGDKGSGTSLWLHTGNRGA